MLHVAENTLLYFLKVCFCPHALLNSPESTVIRTIKPGNKFNLQVQRGLPKYLHSPALGLVGNTLSPLRYVKCPEAMIQKQLNQGDPPTSVTPLHVCATVHRQVQYLLYVSQGAVSALCFQQSAQAPPQPVITSSQGSCQRLLTQTHMHI